MASFPAAATPGEVWKLYKRGASGVKLFPAQQWSPKLLRTLKKIGEFKDVSFIPSGGISPETAPEWLEAGAVAVGMGSGLTGKDLTLHPGDPNVSDATKEWKSAGKSRAEKLIKFLSKEKKSSE